jgi:hypothetical protein
MILSWPRRECFTLETWHNRENKSRFKVVRTDTYNDVPGEIVFAGEKSGECIMHIDGKDETLSFGADGMVIVEPGMAITLTDL